SYVGRPGAVPSRVSLRALASSRLHMHLHSFPTRRSSDLLVIHRSTDLVGSFEQLGAVRGEQCLVGRDDIRATGERGQQVAARRRSEEHTSELQSRENLVCRLLLEKKKNGSHRANWAPRRA